MHPLQVSGKYLARPHVNWCAVTPRGQNLVDLLYLPHWAMMVVPAQLDEATHKAENKAHQLYDGRRYMGQRFLSFSETYDLVILG